MIATLSDAKLMHDLAVQAERDAWIDAYGDAVGSDPCSVSPAARERVEEARRSRREFERELMTYPFLWPKLRCLMVDIVSANNTCEYVALGEYDSDEVYLEPEEAFDLLISREVPNEVYNWLLSNGYHVPDRGLGFKFWHLGVHCTMDESQELCVTLRRRFSDYFDKGLIRMNMKPWSIEWKD